MYALYLGSAFSRFSEYNGLYCMLLHGTDRARSRLVFRWFLYVKKYISLFFCPLLFLRFFFSCSPLLLTIVIAIYNGLISSSTRFDSFRIDGCLFFRFLVYVWPPSPSPPASMPSMNSFSPPNLLTTLRYPSLLVYTIIFFYCAALPHMYCCT